MVSLIAPPLPQTLQTAILRPSSLLFPKSHPPHSSAVFYRSPTSTNPEISLAIVTGRRRSTRLLAMSSSTSEFVPNIGDILGNVTIFKASGEPILFENVWDQNQGVAVVALLRHFGCPCCWELASVLKESKPKFDATGAKLVAVGVGTPDKARILADRLPFPVDCLYADPDRKAYEVLGLYYGVGRTFFNPASAKVFSRFESLWKAVKNYTIKATPDDKSSVLQQGGIFVFKGKQLLYARKDEGTGDHAPLDDIFNVCCKVPVA